MQIAIDSLLTQLKSGSLSLPQADGEAMSDFAEFLFAQPIGSSVIENEATIPLVADIEVEHEAILLELGIPIVIEERPGVAIEAIPEILETLVNDLDNLPVQSRPVLIERTVPAMVKQVSLQSVEHVEKPEDEQPSSVSAFAQKQMPEAPTIYRRNTEGRN